MKLLAKFVLLLMLCLPAQAADMTLERMDTLINRVAENVERRGGAWSFTIEDVPVMIFTDVTADRMRVMTRIRSAAAMTPEEMLRVMQANFESALDARYAVAQGVLWSAFIHPLKALQDEQFLSGIGQTVNAAITYGSTYSSGEIVFHGGDHATEALRRLIDDLLRKGRDA